MHLSMGGSGWLGVHHNPFFSYHQFCCSLLSPSSRREGPHLPSATTPHVSPSPLSSLPWLTATTAEEHEVGPLSPRFDLFLCHLWSRQERGIHAAAQRGTKKPRDSLLQLSKHARRRGCQCSLPPPPPARSACPHGAPPPPWGRPRTARRTAIGPTATWCNQSILFCHTPPSCASAAALWGCRGPSACRCCAEARGGRWWRVPIGRRPGPQRSRRRGGPAHCVAATTCPPPAHPPSRRPRRSWLPLDEPLDGLWLCAGRHHWRWCGG